MKFNIEVRKLRVHAPVGVFPEEKERGNDFEVTVNVAICVADPFADRDDVDVTVDYSRIVELVKEVMAEGCDLVETAALRIGRRVLDEFPSSPVREIESVDVKVAKLNPPIANAEMDYASASVTLHSPTSRRRE